MSTALHYRESVLPSGTRVLTEHMDGVRSVALGLWFAVGSRFETSEEAGMSHFLEHMMFKGTGKRSAAEISESFDRIGAELNAFTGKEYTCYYSRFVDDHLADALDVLADMVTDSSLDQEAVTGEREVVLEEISRHDDAPDELVHDVLSSALWPGHPLGEPILGSRESVTSFTEASVRKYRDTHYRSGELVVAAAGNVDHDAFVDMVSELLAALPQDPADDHGEASLAPSLPISVLQKDTEQAHLCLGMQALPAGHDERFVLAVADTILGGGMSSRLFQEVREKRGLAYAVYSYHSMHRDTGSFSAYVGTRPDNAEEVIKIVDEQFGLLATELVPPQELLKAKESIKGQLVLGLENTRNRMTRLGKNGVTGNEILPLDQTVSRIDDVSADQVRDLVSRLLEKQMTLAAVGPMDAEGLVKTLADGRA